MFIINFYFIFRIEFDFWRGVFSLYSYINRKDTGIFDDDFSGRFMENYLVEDVYNLIDYFIIFLFG